MMKAGTHWRCVPVNEKMKGTTLGNTRKILMDAGKMTVFNSMKFVVKIN